MLMSAKRSVLTLVLAMLAMAAVWFWASALAGGSPVQAATGDKGEVQVDLIIGVPVGTSVAAVVSNIGSSGQDGVRGGDGTFQVDSFFDVSYVSNIGSSGEDGVRASDFQVDSFFDVFYEIDYSGDRGVIETEMIAMQLTGRVSDPSNPGVALDAIRAAAALLKGDIYYGHVTILK